MPIGGTSFEVESFDYWKPLNFEITPVLVSQLEFYSNAERLRPGLTAQRSVTTA